MRTRRPCTSAARPSSIQLNTGPGAFYLAERTAGFPHRSRQHLANLLMRELSLVRVTAMVSSPTPR
jgi:hypothetical protein